LHGTGSEQQTSLPRVVIRSLNAKPDISVIRNAAGAVIILDQAECLTTTVIVIRTTSELFHRCHYVDRPIPGVSRRRPDPVQESGPQRDAISGRSRDRA
jgi:hypothetical protein